MNLSPNFTKGTRPKIGYIIHGTLGSYEGAIAWLCTPPEKRPVVSYSSAHYVIAKDGRCTQLVSDSYVSWHAGNVSNPTIRAQGLLPKVAGKFLNPNESFIGIELEWFLGDKVTEVQYNKVVDIIKTGGIKNPILLCHKEVTDYKSDFQDGKGVLDMSVINEIKKELTKFNIKNMEENINSSTASPETPAEVAGTTGNATIFTVTNKATGEVVPHVTQGSDSNQNFFVGLADGTIITFVGADKENDTYSVTSN